MPEAPSLTAPLSDVMFPLLLMLGNTSTPVWLELLVWFRDEFSLEESSADRDFAERDVWPTLSLTNSSKLDIPMLNARSPIKLYEDPPETAQDAPQLSPMQGRVAKADTATRNKVKRMILNSIGSMTIPPKPLIWWSDIEQFALQNTQQQLLHRMRAWDIIPLKRDRPTHQLNPTFVQLMKIAIYRRHPTNTTEFPTLSAVGSPEWSRRRLASAISRKWVESVGQRRYILKFVKLE